MLSLVITNNSNTNSNNNSSSTCMFLFCCRLVVLICWNTVVCVGCVVLSPERTLLSDCWLLLLLEFSGHVLLRVVRLENNLGVLILH